MFFFHQWIRLKWTNGISFLQLKDMREATILNKKGFQSIDENPDLMAVYPPKPVEFNGEDICSLSQAGQNPLNSGANLEKGSVW